MRLKMIFAPLALLISVIVSIWYIQPAIQEVAVKRDEIKISRETLDSTLTKKKNVDILKSVLDENKEKENFILEYIPSSREDEKITNSLDYAATNAGVTLINLSLEEKAPSTNALVQNPNPTETSGLTGTGDGQIPVAIPVNNLKFISVKLSIAGKYDNLKTFLDQLHSIVMLNRVESVSIIKEVSKSPEGGDAPSDILVANFELKFGYLSQASAGNGSYADVFSRSTFDFTPYSKLIESLTKRVPVLDEGQKGKSNPFLL